MLHRGHFGLGWRHLQLVQATLSEGWNHSLVRHAYLTF